MGKDTASPSPSAFRRQGTRRARNVIRGEGPSSQSSVSLGPAATRRAACAEGHSWFDPAKNGVPDGRWDPLVAGREDFGDEERVAGGRPVELLASTPRGPASVESADPESPSSCSGVAEGSVRAPRATIRNGWSRQSRRRGRSQRRVRARSRGRRANEQGRRVRPRRPGGGPPGRRRGSPPSSRSRPRRARTACVCEPDPAARHRPARRRRSGRPADGV